MRKIILIILLLMLSKITLSQKAIITTDRDVIFKTGIVLVCVGLIIPPDMIRDSHGNWVYKPIYKQPTKIIPIAVGVNFVIVGCFTKKKKTVVIEQQY